MGTILRLKENDIRRIVKRVISEGVVPPCGAGSFKTAVVKVEPGSDSATFHMQDGSKCYCNFEQQGA